MNRFSRSKYVVAAVAAGLVLQAPSLLACAMCYGRNVDSPLTRGMNWGIFSLLAVVGMVLATVASFFIFLARRAAAMAANPAPAPAGELVAVTQKV